MSFSDVAKQLAQQYKSGASKKTIPNNFEDAYKKASQSFSGNKQPLIGKQTLLPKPISTVPVIDKKVKLPFGGVFSTPTDVGKKEARAFNKDAFRGGSFKDKKTEVDHIIPVSLGGTKDKENLQNLKTTKTISQTVFDLVTGHKRSLNEKVDIDEDGNITWRESLKAGYKAKNRQEGKMLVEWDAIDKFKKGELTLNQARFKIIQHQLKPETTKDFIVSSAIETAKKSLGGFFTKAIPDALSTLQKKSKKAFDILGKFSARSGGIASISPETFGIEPEDTLQGRVKKITNNIYEGKELTEEDKKTANEIAMNLFPVAGTVSKSLKGASKLKGVIKQIGPDDAQVMEEFIDHVRLRKPKNLQLELDASKIAEKYELSMPKTNAKLATVFEAQINDLSKVEKSILKPGALVTSKIAPTEVLGVDKVSDVIKPIVGSKERGFITSVKKELPGVQKVSGQYIPRSTDELAIKAKTLIKEDFNTAEKLALTGTDDKAVATASELLKHYNQQALNTTNKATQNILYDQSAKVANSIAAKLTEQGRSVQAASILGRLTPEGQVRFAAREIQRYNETARLARQIPELTGENSKFILNEMKTINEMVDGTPKAMRFQKLQDYISDLVPSPLLKKITSIWKAGLLTGLKTSGLNIFANISHAGTEIIKDIPAVAVDKVASLFTKQRTKGFAKSASIKSVKEGFEKGWRYLTTGFDERNIGAKLDYKRVNFGDSKVAKGLQKYEETVFKILGAEDQVFYYGAKARSLKDQAIAQAKNNKLKGNKAKEFIEDLVENPTDKMIRYAAQDAETAVFQNRTALGDAAKKIQQIGGGLGEVVVPFGRTPSAVATQIINYTPVGIANTIIKNIGKGKFDQRLFSQGIGRGITGTGVMAIGSSLYTKDLITLDRPTSESEIKLWELEGKKPNSVKIGNEWRNIQTLGPAGNVLLIGAHFNKSFNESGSQSEAMTTALSGSAKSFTEQTFLTGLNQLLTTLTDPGKSNYFANLAGSTVPTLIADVGRSIDPRERRAENTLQKIQTRIPIWREELEPQINVLGEERERVGSFLDVMFNPTRPSEEIKTPLIEELRRLFDEGYKVSPTLIGNRKGYNALTQEQNTELWKKTGQIIESKLNNLIKLEDYNTFADDKKAKAVENIVDKGKVIGRVEIVLEVTQGLTGKDLSDKLSELKESGLLTRDVYNKYLELK